MAVYMVVVVDNYNVHLAKNALNTFHLNIRFFLHPLVKYIQLVAISIM